MSWQETILSIKAVIITGGSSGIGAELINCLDNLKGTSFIINLSRTKPSIISETLHIEHLETDLSDRSALAESARVVRERLSGLSKGPVLLVNNAGYGNYGEFSSQGQDELGMIDVNARAAVDLTQQLLPDLKRLGGWVMNVSSIAGFQPTPYLATYGAAKAFLLHWSLATNEELRGSGLKMLAVCPGPTRSEFFRRAGFEDPPNVVAGQSPEEVVHEAFRALDKGKALVVTGRKNRFTVLATHLFSKAMVARIACALMRRFRLAEKKKPLQ
jgi:hypothetical protein